MDGYKVIRESGIAMTSPEGSSRLASLFGEAVGPDDVEVFPFELPAMSVLTPHLHTADLAAWITEGRMAFGFGEGFAERIELGPGDVIWLRANEAHAERVVGDERVTMVVAYIQRFETQPA
ncbi:MAG: cupin domain-containing protein [Actinomycetota bacterium]